MTRDLVHLRGACWLTPDDYASATAEVAAAPPLTAEQRVKLRTLLRPAGPRNGTGPTSDTRGVSVSAAERERRFVQALRAKHRRDQAPRREIELPRAKLAGFWPVYDRADPPDPDDGGGSDLGSAQLYRT